MEQPQKRLRVFLEQYAPLSDNAWYLIYKELSTSSLQKGDYWLRQGRVCRKIAFITEGVMRVCYEEGESDITGYFLKEGQFATHLESLETQIPSEKSIQAITPCHILELSQEAMVRLSQDLPLWPGLVSKITQHILSEKLYNRSPLVSQDARTRYENFLKEQGDIALRVPLTYIASYLGITLPSLSRLRRQLISES